MGTSFALAVQFVTGQTAFLTERPTRLAARRAVALFPVVGLLIGIVLASLWALSSRLWPDQPLVAGTLVLVADALATGARPLGGIARASDGLAADSRGGDRSLAFAVMRDPRRGTAGLIGLLTVLLLKVAFLSALPGTLAGPGLILVVVLGRWATAFAFAAFPLGAAASDDADIHQGLSDAGANELLLATVVVFACAAVLPTRGLLTALAVGLVIGPAAQAVHRRLGGLNAPLCQAFGELGELVALACLTLHGSGL